MIAIALPPRPRPHPKFPFISSSTPPSSSVWPSYGPQIQRAKDVSHFEYDVPLPVASRPRGPPRKVPRPTVFMTTSPRPPSHIMPSMPPEVIQILAQDVILTTPRSHRQIETPPFRSMTTPSSHEDFNEGFKILSNLFLEDGSSDLRSNKIGGSQMPLSRGHYSMPGSKVVSQKEAPTPANTTHSGLEITPANEQPLIVESESSSEDQKGETKPTPLSPSTPQMQQSETSFGPSQFRLGPSNAHSFMFSDPMEGPPGPPGYRLYDDGFPPAPFHSSNDLSLDVAPPQQPPQQEVRGADDKPSNSQHRPLPANVGYGGPNQFPMMMMPISTGDVGGPIPSSEEVQQALSVLARYASTQPQANMGMQLMQQAKGSSPSTKYGAPPPQQEGQSTPIPAFLPPVIPNPPETTKHLIASPVAQQEESSPYPAYGLPGPPAGGGSAAEIYGPPNGGYSDTSSSTSGGFSSGGGWSSTNGVGGGFIREKVNALKTITSAVTGGFKQVAGLKAGIFNAGLGVISTLGKTKSNLANSIKVPIALNKVPGPIYGPPSPVPTYGQLETTSPVYGVPVAQEGPVGVLLNGVKEVVGGVVGTVAQTGKAAVGISLSKNEFVKNHFAIKGQAFTETMSKKFANKNQYFQNVLRHMQSIFDAAASKPNGGWGQ